MEGFFQAKQAYHIQNQVNCSIKKKHAKEKKEDMKYELKEQKEGESDVGMG